MNSDSLIRAYAASARPVMLEFLAHNSCIAAARTTLDFLERYGIESRVQPCKFTVEWKDQNLAYTSGLTDAERSMAMSQRQAWPEGWNGHLIVIAGRFIVDPSFDQALVGLGITPETSMLLLESATNADGALDIELALHMDSGADLKVRYVPLFDESYRNTEAWNDIGLPFLVSEIATRLSLAQGGRPHAAAGK